MEQSFIAYIENSIKNNWDLDALTDYKGATLQYKDVARKIEKLHIIFEESGIRKGDKIAVCGRNSSHWGVTFPRHTNVWSSHRPHPSRVQSGQCAQHRQPFRSQITICRRHGLGKPERIGNASAGRYPDDERLHLIGTAQRTADTCPRTSERNVRQEISGRTSARNTSNTIKTSPKSWQ